MFMEAQRHSANATAATKMFVVAMMAFCLAIARVRAEEGPSEDSGMLCVSKCGTCPVICSQSPPPPSPSQIYIIHTSPPPPQSENNPPPPSLPRPKGSSSSQPTPPAGKKPRGGLSSPYYYLYTADAPQLFISSISLWFLVLLIYFVNLGVFHCGYHSEISYGATSYHIVHPEGNILVDSPRYEEILARKIEKLGGARYMFLTHKDDIGDHEKWAKRLNCERILHSGDLQDSTADVEMQLYGDGPWSINTDIELFHTPGHTAGSVCLYYKPLKALFTGDHFFKSEDSELGISLIYNQLSVSMQLDNIRKLLDLDFVWILPGHGRRAEFRDNQEKNSAIKAFLALSKQSHA